MAKGVEDTAFYRYSRLVSLNEVGGDPDRFGSTVEATKQRGPTGGAWTAQACVTNANSTY